MGAVQNVLPPPPRQSAGAAPVRKPGSIRRTSSIDVWWPEGQDANLHLIGRARDILTPTSGGAPITLATDAFEAVLTPRVRTVVSISATPARPPLARLVGEPAGKRLRPLLAELVPQERERATPLYLLLDDIPGASLVSGWARSQWDPNWLVNMKKVLDDPEFKKTMPTRENVCVGLASGSSAYNYTMDSRQGARVPDLRNSDDPKGWHEFPTLPEGCAMRRARRIDVWLDDTIVIDTAFQDSSTTPEGGRAAVHEYTLRVTADPVSLRLLSIVAEPRVLPMAECPGAVANLPRLIGTPLPELREKVIAELRGTAGCTHLNDAMRALAEVPVLVGHLRQATQV